MERIGSDESWLEGGSGRRIAPVNARHGARRHPRGRMIGMVGGANL